MNRLLLALALGFALVSPALGMDTVTWPPAPLSPGVNPATTPAPQLIWFQQFQQRNLDEPKKMPTVDLIFDGDSITDRWRGTGKGVWAAHYAKLNAVDFGIIADKTENLLWRIQNGQLDNLHPKLVALMIGTNNIGQEPAQIAEGVQAVVEDYRTYCSHAVILLQAILPRGQSPTDPNRAKIKAVNQIISKLADGKNVIYIDFGDKLLQPDGTISTDIMADFLHPTAKGYEIWAEAIQPIIDKYVPSPTPAK